MTRSSLLPPETLYCLPFLPDDFVDRLDYFKEVSGLTWDGMAYCMGVDPRQVRRWRHGPYLDFAPPSQATGGKTDRWYSETVCLSNGSRPRTGIRMRYQAGGG